MNGATLFAAMLLQAHIERQQNPWRAGHFLDREVGKQIDSFTETKPRQTTSYADFMARLEAKARTLK